MFAQFATVLFGLVAFLTIASPATSQATAPEPRVFTTILVVGNDRFRDGDILSTSGLQTGVPLGQEELLSAVEALEFTGEFEDVVISSSGQVLTISVDETPEYSGGLTFGAGYDSDFGLFGAAGLSLNNAFGNDTHIRSNLLVAEQAQTLRFQIRSDHFWSQDIKGGVRLAYENYDFDNTTFDFTIGKIEPYVVFDLSDKALVELRYTLATKDISDVDPAASPIILDEAGRRSSSGIGFSIATGSSSIIAENPLFDPWTVRFDQDFTGLGGDTDLSHTKLSLFALKRLSASGLAFRTTVEIGSVNGLSGDRPRASALRLVDHPCAVSSVARFHRAMFVQGAVQPAAI